MARIASAARVESPPRPKVERRNLVARMAPAPTQGPAPAPKPRKRSSRPRKRRKGKTEITRAVNKLDVLLKRPYSTNLQKAEACFKITWARMKAYEQEQAGMGKVNAAVARRLDARFGENFHKDKMKEYLAAAKEELQLSDIYCGVPHEGEYFSMQYMTIEEYWNEYPAGRADAFIVYKYDMGDGSVRFARENGIQVKTRLPGDVHYYDRWGSKISWY
ncbi:hypothetical protein EAE96_008103 [Botrytis aclada]|nr:hypothetical protein EAE96_008103 [Botrytis aclada]